MLTNSFKLEVKSQYVGVLFPYFGVLLFLIPVILTSVPESLTAQDERRQATIFGWEDRLHWFLMDRSNNFGGILYDRGLFRYHTREMDAEYRLDEFTYAFTPFEDYQWMQKDNALRIQAGSIDNPILLLHSQIRQHVDLGGPHSFVLEGTQQEDLRADRFFLNLGYRYQISEPHILGISQTLGKRKTDQNVTFYYQAGTQQKGLVRFNAIFLDWPNNIISVTALHRESRYDIRQVYEIQPRMFTVRAATPLLFETFRAELGMGIQTRSRSRVYLGEQPDEEFINNKWVHYTGGLLEVHVAPLTLGSIFQREFNRIHRYGRPGSGYEADYGNRQLINRGGFYILTGRSNWIAEGWVWIERFRDQRFDENPQATRQFDPYINRDEYMFDFRETRSLIKARIHRDPHIRGVRVGIEFNGDYRKPGEEYGQEVSWHGESYTIYQIPYRNYYPNQIVHRNDRLSLWTGYRFSSRLWLLFGASIDLDGDRYNGWQLPREDPSPYRFDGAFGRMMINW